MKQFRYSLNRESLRFSNEENKASDKVIFENVFAQGLRLIYKDGLLPKTRRSYERILNALDAAKDGFIEVEEGDFELFNAVFNEEKGAKFDPAYTRTVAQYIRAIDDAGVKLES